MEWVNEEIDSRRNFRQSHMTHNEVYVLLQWHLSCSMLFTSEVSFIQYMLFKNWSKTRGYSLQLIYIIYK